jgi:uncharacterized membrane protein HdeD (DUF308 family)
MLEMVARSWWILLLRGVLAIGFGVAALAWPEITILALVIVFGAYALVDGVLDIMMAAGGRGPAGVRLSGMIRTWLVVMGLIGIAAGLVAFFWPDITAVALLWVIAFWAILVGILQLLTAWRLRAELTNEWMFVLAGLLSMALGVLLAVRPDVGALAVVAWIGIFAIAWGVALSILAFRVKGLATDAAPATG